MFGGGVFCRAAVLQAVSQMMCCGPQARQPLTGALFLLVVSCPQLQTPSHPYAEVLILARTAWLLLWHSAKNYLPGKFSQSLELLSTSVKKKRHSPSFLDNTA